LTSWIQKKVGENREGGSGGQRVVEEFTTALKFTTQMNREG